MATANSTLNIKSDHIRAVRVFGARVRAGVFGACCALLTVFAHYYYGFPVYGYLGMPYEPLSIDEILILVLVCAIPGFFLPKKAFAPSDLIVSVIYFYCYVPAVTMMFATGLLQGAFLFAHVFSITLGFLMVTLLASQSVRPLRPIKMKRQVFVGILLFFYFVFGFWIIAENHSTMRLAAFTEVYDQRSIGGSAIGTSGYALGMMSSAINPFLMAYGLMCRRPDLFVLGFVGQIMCYSVGANKIMLLAVIYIPALYYLLGGRKGHVAQIVPSLRWMGPVYVGLISFGLGLAVLYYQSYAAWIDALTSQIVMRLVLLPGALNAQYAHFFESNPVTYMTHVGFGRLFVGSSTYAESVSQTIGNFMAGGERGQNANVSFFAYDGIASFGPYGAPIIGFVVGLALRLFNMVLRREMLNVGLLSLSSFAFNLAEGSFFAAMLTHGGLLMLVLLYLMPYDD